MNESGAVSVFECTCHLPHENAGLKLVHPTVTSEPSLKTLAGQKFHHQVRSTIVHARVHRSNHVWMTQTARGLGFAHEPMKRFRIASERGQQKLDGEISIRPFVASGPDFPHPSFS
jgi:hypothetical protein